VKLEFYQTMIYRGPDHGDSWPAPPRVCDSEWAQVTYDHSLDECGAAIDAGFTSINFAEHHYSPKQLTPNPIVFAAIAGRRFSHTQIGIFGTDLPLNNPVRIAEEYAMLDNLLGGRLRIGLLRGTPNEYITYGTNPWESRERAEEGALLIKRAFSEPEPFGWEGRYYRYRSIAVWPRPAQPGGPRILISGNSPDGAVFAGKHGFDVGFSYLAAEKAAEHVALYRASAVEHGWQPSEDNIAYRHFMYVDETDEAVAEARPHFEGIGLAAIFNGATPDTMMAMGRIGAAMAGVPKEVQLDPANAPKFVPSTPLYGSPDTVIAQIAHLKRTIGMGRLEVSIGAINPLPHEWSMRTLKLIGEHVAPVVHAEDF
jgi:alkanesulfonate monooxygenase SsuD/methylene tetrahydromethanopterin reductase-like flavin-dependent oxidoreductase (luciferase family)